MVTWRDDFEADFYSDDPLARHNAHMAAKGNPSFPDPDLVRKVARENPKDEQTKEDDAA